MDVTDGELLEYISESSTMSKAMDEYDGARLAAPALPKLGVVSHCCCAATTPEREKRV